jgi:predicted GNAT family acetyltransferase
VAETRVERVAHGDHKGAFVVLRGEERLAEMTWSRAGETRVMIDHTWVSDELRGLGIARKLLEHAVAWAREERLLVVPVCPYAKAQFDKDQTICDVLDR